jgi:hypothetical protein
MKNNSFRKIILNTALSTQHHALSTVFEELHFFYTIFSPKRKYSCLWELKLHQNFTK